MDAPVIRWFSYAAAEKVYRTTLSKVHLVPTQHIAGYIYKTGVEIHVPMQNNERIVAVGAG